MQKNELDPREAERATFEACRTIDVTDRQAVRFWSDRLGVTPEEIAQVVKEVGPNTTAVALKLEAPAHDPAAVPSPLSPC